MLQVISLEPVYLNILTSLQSVVEFARMAPVTAIMFVVCDLEVLKEGGMEHGLAKNGGESLCD